VPLEAKAPLQPPAAVHAVAFVELQVSEEDAPLAMVVGAALIEAVGGGSVATGLSLLPQAANASDASDANATQSPLYVCPRWLVTRLTSSRSLSGRS